MKRKEPGEIRELTIFTAVCGSMIRPAFFAVKVQEQQIDGAQKVPIARPVVEFQGGLRKHVEYQRHAVNLTGDRSPQTRRAVNVLHRYHLKQIVNAAFFIVQPEIGAPGKC